MRRCERTNLCVLAPPSDRLRLISPLSPVTKDAPPHTSPESSASPRTTSPSPSPTSSTSYRRASPPAPVLPPISSYPSVLSSTSTTLAPFLPSTPPIPIARLAHGLDRVLFNPGVHVLRDPPQRRVQLPYRAREPSQGRRVCVRQVTAVCHELEGYAVDGDCRGRGKDVCELDELDRWNALPGEYAFRRGRAALMRFADLLLVEQGEGGQHEHAFRRVADAGELGAGGR